MLPQPGASPRAVEVRAGARPAGGFRALGSPVRAAGGVRPLVTAEGVVVELQAAGLCSRVTAALLDLLVVYAVASTVGGLLGVALGLVGGPLGVIVGLVAGGGALLAYPIVLETLWDGRTVGKAAVGLRVVGTAGGPIGFRQAAIRGALLLVDAVALPLAAPWFLGVVGSAQHRRLGDLAAGTMVVRVRRGDVGVARPLAFVPPPPLEPFVRRLDVGGLDDEDYRLVRDVLVRQAGLAEPARRVLNDRTAMAVAARLGHPVLPWMGAVDYLVCVLGAYQLRHRPPPGERH